MLDKFSTFLQQAPQFPAAILGNPRTADYELIDLAVPLPDTEELRSRMAARGLQFIGTVGLVNGAPQSALEEVIDDSTIQALSAAYLGHVGATIHRHADRTNNPALHELAALFALKDPRTA